MASLVSSEQINEFREQGVTVLKGVFSDWVDVLRKGVDANMADPDPNARIYTGKDGGGRRRPCQCRCARSDRGPPYWRPHPCEAHRPSRKTHPSGQ